jgi:hypothetical protein
MALHNNLLIKHSPVGSGQVLSNNCTSKRFLGHMHACERGSAMHESLGTVPSKEGWIAEESFELESDLGTLDWRVRHLGHFWCPMAPAFVDVVAHQFDAPKMLTRHLHYIVVWDVCKHHHYF